MILNKLFGDFTKNRNRFYSSFNDEDPKFVFKHKVWGNFLPLNGIHWSKPKENQIVEITVYDFE